MSHDLNHEDMQGHDTHTQNPFHHHQRLIDNFRRRIEDPNDSTDSPLVLEALGEALVISAKELKTALVAPDDPSKEEDKNKDEHFIQVMHARLNIVQAFLEATTSSSSPSQAAAQTCKCQREEGRRDPDFYKLKLQRFVVACLPFILYILSVAIPSWTKWVRDLFFASLVLLVIFKFF